MIDRPLVTPTGLLPPPGGLGGATVGLAPLDPRATSIENADGSVDVYLEGLESSLDLADLPHDANLAEALDEQTLMRISSDLRFAIDEDKTSRHEWEDALAKGMDLLGIKDQERTTPWPGSCGVVHPMILEAAVRFQSKSITRLFPPEGPANVKVVGLADTSKIQQAKRVATDLNYWLTDRMPEYRDETEQLLFALPVDGSAFKKVFQDPLLKRPVAQYVPASDFLMPYGFPNLETTPRYTHVMKQAYGDILELQAMGFYRNVPLSRNPIDLNRMEQKVARLSGVSPSYTHHELLTLWETATSLDIEGSMRPYVVTMDADTNKVLAVRRNWREGDDSFAKLLNWVHYRYVPWKGPYGLGLIHLIGGIGHSSTAILRQLIDAGTLSNLPGGLKSMALRIKGDNDPIQPGEFRDVDVPAGKILDSIAFLPYKEPSAVLFQLLQMLVEEGKAFASIAELDLNASTQNAPVGTMLALIERATEVITAVQSRMHTALGRELALIAELIRDHTDPDYDYDPAPAGTPRSMKEIDYREAISIQPVSDPAASTMAQRVMEYQAALQLSAQAPQLYDLPLLHRSMLEVLGIDHADQIVPDKTAAEPQDPVAENMALLTSKPVRAFPWQNHQAHIGVHMAMFNDPQMKSALAQNPLAPSIQQATFSHINEHLAYQYRQQIEQAMGTQLPPLGSNLPADAEEQISALTAQAAQKVLQQNQAAAAGPPGGGGGAPGQPDPILQQAQQEAQLRAQEIQQRGASDQAKIALERDRMVQKGQIESAKLVAAQQREMLQIQAENQRHGLSEAAESNRVYAGHHAETTRHLMGLRVDQAKHEADQAQQGFENAQSLAPPVAPPEETPGG